MGQFKEALEHLNKAAEMEPDTLAYANAAADAKKRMYATLSKAEITKMEGNDFFKAGEFDKAIAKYTLAISQVDTSDKEKSDAIIADLYANRAMAHQQRWNSDQVVADCTSALKYNPNHIKALVRRAQAYEALEKYQESLNDFEQAVKLAPDMQVAFKGAVRVRATLRKSKQL